MLSELLNRIRSESGDINNYMKPCLSKIITLFQQIEEIAEGDYFEVMVRQEYSKGSFLLKEGAIPKHIWFMEKGLARRFMNKDGVEINQHFFFPGEFLFLYGDTVLSTPAVQNIQFLEDSIVYSIRWEVFERLKMKYILLHQVESLVIASYLGWVEQKVSLCQHSTAMKRYVCLIKMQPHLVDRVPHHYIASYLDITRETLSRIRSELDKIN